MSRLIDFTPDFVPNRFGDQIPQLAVLTPLMGKIATGGPGSSRLKALEDRRRTGDVIDETHSLIEAWRSRVDQLGQAGFAPFAEEGSSGMRNRNFAKNCRPTFFVPKQTARCCRRATVCPFCWARETLVT